LAALQDVTGQSSTQLDVRRLADIVESSDDAIISKSLDGVVLSWNNGAARIFGYVAEEMIGNSIERLVPPELRHEEREIIAKLSRGERVLHYETVRLFKDDSAFSRVPVIVRASSATEIDVLKSYDLNANSYIVKPSDFDQPQRIVAAIQSYWLTVVAHPNATRVGSSVAY
jgi:PAS domain S-box-containing protein